MLGESLKTKDPMKVGKFGLGFKSVFHLTGKFNMILLQKIKSNCWYQNYKAIFVYVMKETYFCVRYSS